MPAGRLEQRLVLEATAHPRRRLQTLRLYGLTVHGAHPEGTGLDPLQCVSHLLQDGRIALGFVEVSARIFLGDTGVPKIGDTLVTLLAAQLHFTLCTRHEVPLEIEESLFVVQRFHDIPTVRPPAALSMPRFT